MSFSSIFSIAGSALTAQSQRMNAIASNLANADSVAGPDGRPYRARQVVFELDAAPGAAVGGVRVARVIEDQSPLRREFDPSSPLADEEGYIEMPNVDPSDEMVNMISASRSYQANLEVLNTQRSLVSMTLSLGQG
ncbi:flagellar basal body rod protein FlgC [Halotalea alkalilenta]|uniref:Flagellar basal-body rod protein FlgC n=1 Tax=Halotalea alkalilenta TaxID=376489 RepID=A0A172YHC2_9GAMM|nr:flagellar basal body rod protein FlgC [Halotalea alkalilenta]ANF58375.1 flagellar basal body rod protein FlgC [Halotalea alkalilenta]